MTANPNAANRDNAVTAIQPGGMDTVSLLSRVHQGSAADLQPHELDRLVTGEFIFFIFVWAISMTSCFVHRVKDGARRRDVRANAPAAGG